MPPDRLSGRLSYVFLCAAPFIAVIVAALRTLRASGLHHAIGIVLFVAIAIAVWTLGGWAIGIDTQGRRQLALGGMLLVAPFALIALLWVGLGTPWEATAQDNQMRYLVLSAAAIAEVGGFVMIRAALTEAGERFHASILLAAIMLAGPLYLVWDTSMFGVCVAEERAGSMPSAFATLNPALEVLLDMAAALTYVATAALAMSLGRVQWLGRRAMRAFVSVNVVALLFVANRVLASLSPADGFAPWYAVPGFAVTIPAVPYIMPFLLGVLMLRRAGDERR